MAARPSITEKELRDRNDLLAEVLPGNPGPGADDQRKAAEAERGDITTSASDVADMPKGDAERDAAFISPDDAALYFYRLLPAVNQKQFMQFCDTHHKEPHQAMRMIVRMATEHNHILATAGQYDLDARGTPMVSRQTPAQSGCPVCGRPPVEGARFCSNKCGALWQPEEATA